MSVSVNISNGDLIIDNGDLILTDIKTGWRYKIVVENGELKSEPIEKEAKRDKNIKSIFDK